MRKIKKIEILLLIVIAGTVSFWGYAKTKATETIPNHTLYLSAKQDYDYASEVLTLVNKERAKEGLVPVVLDASLTESAMQRAAEIHCFCGHSRPNRTFLTKVDGRSVMENIALNQSTPEEVMNDWMHSEGHRYNIMDPDWRSVGIGVVLCNNSYSWCQLFSQKTAEGTIPNGKIKKKFSLEVSEAYLNMASVLPDTLKKDVKITLNQSVVNFDYLTFFPDSDSFRYESSDVNVATIDNTGFITLTGTGTTTISVYYQDNTLAYQKYITCNKDGAAPLQIIKSPILQPTTTPNVVTHGSITTAPVMATPYVSTGSLIKTNIDALDIKIETKKYYYRATGKAVRPKVYVTSSLVEGVDYEIYYKNNIKPGLATIILKGIGDYEGMITGHFYIQKTNYRVYFHQKNGKATKKKIIAAGNTVMKFIPKRKGYRFTGWYRKGKKFSFKTKISKNIHLYARWKKKK
ncbi:MAG: InlB B-repeat-containing protein [Lachnospiraceae bacterium]|nr:InlB B-repeat-containing protein [Lachnospiraceae bacterium]